MLQPRPTSNWKTAYQQSWADDALLQHLRLGYCMRDELCDDFDGRTCEHCEERAQHPLVHYLLSYPATARLMPVPASPPNQQEAACP